MPAKHLRDDEVWVDPVTVVKDVTYPNIKFIWGWSFDETAGAAVEMVLRNGGATGDILANVNMLANATANMSYYRPLRAQSGLHITLVTGAFAGRVHV